MVPLAYDPSICDGDRRIRVSGRPGLCSEGLSQNKNEEEWPGDPSGAISVIRARTMHAHSVWLLQQSYAC